MTNTMKFFKELERYGLVKDSQFVLNIPLELLREIVDKFSEIPEHESKGSDGHELDDDIPPTSQYFPTSSQTTSDKWKEYQDWLNEITELSDEQIEKEGWKYCYENKISSTNIVHWITACKWYREQLKSK